MPIKTNNKPHLTLATPSRKYKTTYLEYIKEVFAEDEEVVPFVLNTPADNFDSLLSELDGYSRGENMKPGFVSHSTFWLIEEEEKVVGATNIRHDLTEKLRLEGGHIGYGIRPSSRGKGYGTEILKLALIEARKLGHKRVLVTCDKDNVKSAKVILRNGGELHSEVSIKEKQIISQRYWIDIID